VLSLRSLSLQRDKLTSALLSLNQNAAMSLAWQFHDWIGMLGTSLGFGLRVQKSNRERLLALCGFGPKNGTFVILGAS
jgi:hypothetical protein